MKGTIALPVIFCCLVVAVASSDDGPIITKELVDHINSIQSSWVASTEQGAIALKTRSEARALAGAIKTAFPLPLRTHKHSVIQNIPTNYDARLQYPYCETIQQIRDQSSCGSCWAFGAVEAMSDRYCILLNKTVTLGAGNLMSCCPYCSAGNGCNGGYPNLAWWYWSQTGIVTEECQPYPLPPCSPPINGSIYENCPPEQTAPPCNNITCANGLMYSKALHPGQSAYDLSGETDMVTEIFKYGPIEAHMKVYEDFYAYKSGIYKHVTGQYLGGHAIKLIGFGVEQGQKYWLAANSWNTFWGMNGFFKIARGTNECNIEDSAFAGLPLY